MKAFLRLVIAYACCAIAWGASPRGTDNFGPYNSTFLEGGVGQSRPLSPDAPLLGAQAPWSLTGWVRLTTSMTGTVVIASIGTREQCRCLVLQDGRLALRLGGNQQLRTPQSVDFMQWHEVFPQLRVRDPLSLQRISLHSDRVARLERAAHHGDS